MQALNVSPSRCLVHRGSHDSRDSAACYCVTAAREARLRLRKRLDGNSQISTALQREMAAELAVLSRDTGI